MEIVDGSRSAGLKPREVAESRRVFSPVGAGVLLPGQGLVEAVTRLKGVTMASRVCEGWRDSVQWSIAPAQKVLLCSQRQPRCTGCSGFRSSPAQGNILVAHNSCFFLGCNTRGLGWPQPCLTYWIPGAQSVLGWAGVAGFLKGAEWWLDLNLGLVCDSKLF